MRFTAFQLRFHYLRKFFVQFNSFSQFFLQIIISHFTTTWLCAIPHQHLCCFQHPLRGLAHTRTTGGVKTYLHRCQQRPDVLRYISAPRRKKFSRHCTLTQQLILDTWYLMTKVSHNDSNLEKQPYQVCSFDRSIARKELEKCENILVAPACDARSLALISIFIHFHTISGSSFVITIAVTELYTLFNNGKRHFSSQPACSL